MTWGSIPLSNIYFTVWKQNTVGIGKCIWAAFLELSQCVGAEGGQAGRVCVPRAGDPRSPVPVPYPACAPGESSCDCAFLALVAADFRL